MKQKFVLAATVLAAASLLASCGGSGTQSGGYPSHNGAYDTASSLEGADKWDGTLGNATGLLGKKVSFTYQENVEVKVNANGGSADFSRFKVKTNVTTTGYFDFSATDFYGYVKTVYADENNADTNYTKEGLIRKNSEGSYEYITTDLSEYIPLGTVYAAFAASFNVVGAVGNTKASHLNSNAFIYSGDTIDWLYDVVGLASNAGNKEEDWEDVAPAYGKASDGSLVVKATCPIVGYTTDQGVSDFGASNTGKDSAYAQLKVGTAGYITDWAVDYNGDKASLDFAIMTPAPTVTVTGSRYFNANYAATEQEHKEDIDHAAPIVKKYSTFSVTAGTGVTGYTVSRMVMSGNNPTGMADITTVGYDETVDNLWFAIKPTTAEGATVSVKVGDADAMYIGGMYCVNASTEGNYNFVITTDQDSATNATASAVYDAGVTEAVVKYLDVPNFASMAEVPAEGVEAKTGRYFVVKPTLADGKTVDKVLANGVDVTATAASFGGFYGVKAETAGYVQFNIVTK